MFQTPDRCQVLDCLPVTRTYNLQIFIKSTKEETISWSTFLHPFSIMLWVMLLSSAVIIATLLTVLERYFGLFDESFLLHEYLIKIWITIKANFGGEPGYGYENTSLKIILLGCLLAGVVNWGAYQASLTSELSVIKLKLPFNDLESLHKSDFRS